MQFTMLYRRLFNLYLNKNSIEYCSNFRKTLKNTQDFFKIQVCKLLKIIYDFKYI